MLTELDAEMVELTGFQRSDSIRRPRCPVAAVRPRELAWELEESVEEDGEG